MTHKTLHFTLGPVQGFIADARRLRDYWAGSFILSLLSGHAMKAVQDAGGEIKFPNVTDDPLFKALDGEEDAPFVGSLPNRFKAEVPVALADTIGKTCEQAVIKAWTAICDGIWEAYIKDAAGKGQNAKAIWDRQVNHFWEMSWVVGDDPGNGSDGAWLDQRKNWRTHLLTGAEDGDHCRLMGQYQEISGYHRIGESKKQSRFWEAVRDNIVRNSDEKTNLDIQKDEYLCAIALVKRLFPVLVHKKEKIDDAIGFCPGKDQKINIRHWPSTSYVAAVPWLKLIQNEGGDQSGYVETTKDIFKQKFYGEWESRQFFDLPDEKLYKLDGHLLHKDGIPGFVKERGVDAGNVTTLQRNLPKLPKTYTKRTAPEFYALLRMDGDGIGSRLEKDAELIKTALGDFTNRVTKQFENKSIEGVLIYAGGDDVLAILPAEGAIDAALTLQQEYLAAFEQAGTPKSDAAFTISASILYAHFKRTPLSAVIRTSEHYLDKIAKEQNGRNSMALAVMKPGGIMADWVSTFENGGGRFRLLAQVASGKMGGANDPEISGGFFHGFQSKYASMFDNNSEATKDTLTALLGHQLRTQFGGKMSDQNRLEQEAEKLSALYLPLYQDGAKQLHQHNKVHFGAGMIARFLSREVILAKKEEAK